VSPARGGRVEAVAHTITHAIGGVRSTHALAGLATVMLFIMDEPGAPEQPEVFKLLAPLLARLVAEVEQIPEKLILQ
jgi:hypothetical protein